MKLLADINQTGDNMLNRNTVVIFEFSSTNRLLCFHGCFLWALFVSVVVQSALYIS